MIGSILVRMPELTKEFDEEIGVEIINKYFVRLKSDIYIPLFNLPLLYPEILSGDNHYDIVIITFKYYEKYLELRKHKQFKVKVFLPEKYGGYALYYLLQKFMIGEATPEEIKIISEFLSREIFDGKNIDMWDLLYQYYESIYGLLNTESGYIGYKKTIFINTPVGATPLYVSKTFLDMCIEILMTLSNNYYNTAFVNVLTSHFFGKSIQIGSTKFNLLKSIGELDLNWKNVKVISFRELYDVRDAIIENNLEMTHPETFKWSRRDYYHTSMFLSHSPILSVVANAIDFKNKSVVLLFAMLKREVKNATLTEFNHSFYLDRKKDIEFFVVSVPFKNIKKFIFREGINSGVFIIRQNGKTIPVLSADVGLHWVGVGRKNIVIDREDGDVWYKLLRELASPEHLKKAEEKTRCD